MAYKFNPFTGKLDLVTDVTLSASNVTFDSTGLTNTSANNVQDAISDLDGAIPAEGANKSLSNLTLPTDINQDLVPDAVSARSLGTNSDKWRDGYINNRLYIGGTGTGGAANASLTLQNSFNSQRGQISVNNITFPTNEAIAGSADFAIYHNNTSPNNIGLFTRTATGDGIPTGSVGIISGNHPNATATNDTGGIYLGTGRNVGTAGTADTGGIYLYTGNATGGNSGDIRLAIGSAGTTPGKIRLIAGADDVILNAQPTGGTALAVATTQYVDTAVIGDFGGTFGEFGGGIKIQNNDGAGNPGTGTVTVAQVWDLGGAEDYVLLGNSVAGQGLYVGTQPTFSGAGDSGFVDFTSGDVDSGISGDVNFKSGASNSGTTGGVTLKSGNAGTGTSGTIKIEVGTGSTARGVIQLVDGTEGTSGHLWASQDASGSGNWVSISDYAGTGIEESSGTLVQLGLYGGSFGAVTDDGIRVRGSSSNILTPVAVWSAGGVETFGTDTIVIGNSILGEGVWMRTLSSSSGTTTGDFRMDTGNNTSTGGSGSMHILTGTTTSGTSGGLVIETGAASSGGTTGGLTFQTGTTSGTRGTIKLVDGSEGTSGDVWTSTDANGSGQWQTLPQYGKTELTSFVTTGLTQSLGQTPIANSVTVMLQGAGALLEDIGNVSPGAGYDYAINGSNIVFSASLSLTDSDVAQVSFVY